MEMLHELLWVVLGKAVALPHMGIILVCMHARGSWELLHTTVSSFRAPTTNQPSADNFVGICKVGGKHHHLSSLVQLFIVTTQKLCITEYSA